MNSKIVFSDEVREALKEGRPVVALESAFISHGMPYPESVKTALACERIARRHGAVAAFVAVLNGDMHVGLSEEQIDYLGRRGSDIEKVSRRDLPVVIGKGLDGAATVAAAAFIAGLAGIKLLVAGSIGGVHRGAEATLDISADLTELSRTPVAVVCAGPHNALDVALTIEYLETHGVPLISFRAENVPAFCMADSGFRSPCRADSIEELCGIVRAIGEAKLGSGAVIANPIPEKYAPNADRMDKATIKAVREAEKRRIDGRELTPFLLKHIAEQTNGASLEANIAILYNNVRLASLVAAELCEGGKGGAADRN